MASALICCPLFDRVGFFWASENRRSILRLELGLQAVTITLYITVLSYVTSNDYHTIRQAPLLYNEVRDMPPPWGEKYNGPYYMNARYVTMKANSSRVDLDTRYVTSPDNRYEGLSFDFNYHDDGSVDVISSVQEFKKLLQANYDAEYARPHSVRPP